MYRMGSCNEAGATKCIGEVTVAPSAGVKMQTDPAEPGPGLAGLAGAESGKGATPVCGPCAIMIGTAAQFDCGVPEFPPALPPPLLPLPPPGLEVEGVVGGVGAGVVDVICERPPQALAPTSRQAIASTLPAFVALSAPNR